MKNPSFELGWADLPPAPGNLINQQPKFWLLSWKQPGENLTDSGDQAQGVPECRHLSWEHLPADERPGGPNALIIDGDWCFKMFHATAPFESQLRQTITGLKPGSTAVCTFRVQVHDHKTTDPYAAEFRVNDRWWHVASGQMQRQAWATRVEEFTVPASGELALELIFKSKYGGVDFFVDHWEFQGEYDDGGSPPDPDPDPEPPPTDDLQEQIDDLKTELATVENLMVNLQQTVDEQQIKLDDHERRLVAIEAGTPQPPPELITLPARSLAVDVSAHQGVFDWETAVTRGLQFAVLRSSNGLGSTSTDASGRDKQLYRNAAECARLGIPFSIYHYLQPGQVNEQAALVHDILNDLIQQGTPATGAIMVRELGGSAMTRLLRRALAPLGVSQMEEIIFPPQAVDVELYSLTNDMVRQFHDSFDACAIYSRVNVWEAITKNVAAWWADAVAWMAQYGQNSGQVPAETAVPLIPRGFKRVSMWQFTSVGGPLLGWPGGLDVNLTGPFAATAAKTYPVDFLRADPAAWRVIRRADGSGEDVWDLPTPEGFCRVKNAVNGEFYSTNGRIRFLDNDPAPDSQGNKRIYIQTTDGAPGGQIAPDTAVLGQEYEFWSDVQFYAKDGKCTPLAENSGRARSTFRLVEVRENATLASGVKLDRLYVTEQTGETQLYGVMNGRKLGWIGGGSTQPGNTWSGTLAEVYFDRVIPGAEPKRWCG